MAERAMTILVRWEIAVQQSGTLVEQKFAARWESMKKNWAKFKELAKCSPNFFFQANLIRKEFTLLPEVNDMAKEHILLALNERMKAAHSGTKAVLQLLFGLPSLFEQIITIQAHSIRSNSERQFLDVLPKRIIIETLVQSFPRPSQALQPTSRSNGLRWIRNSTQNLLNFALQFCLGNRNYTFVGIHVRRGKDITEVKSNVDHGHTVATKEYFEHAMDYFR